ncbi:MAG: GGDEF domain-containing protein [Acidobacteria bacterium]|nr:GGDEF domain-containing protein [Acidobacteriota bacterium]
MASQELITVDWKRAASPTSAPQSDWLRGFVARALVVMGELVSAEDDPADLPLVSELEQLAQSVGLVPDGQGDAAHSCLVRVQAVSQRIRKRRNDRKREMMDLVALVRDAVSSVGVEMNTLHDSIDASTNRFEMIAELDDPLIVKNLLVSQVAVLKKVAAERRAAWDAKQRAFNDKVTQLEQQLQASRREASQDALTGASNRGALDRELMTRVRLADSRFVLAMLDLDNFKGINDTHGHAVGDRVLVMLAQGLRRMLRDEDLVARLGGDEFAVVIRNMTLKQAEARFVGALGKLFVPPADEPPLPTGPTVSCGLAEFSTGDTTTSLYERADRALYAAKHEGKNRVVVKEKQAR